jgi:hypothetical protein
MLVRTDRWHAVLAELRRQRLKETAKRCITSCLLAARWLSTGICLDVRASERVHSLSRVGVIDRPIEIYMARRIVAQKYDPAYHQEGLTRRDIREGGGRNTGGVVWRIEAPICQCRRW